MVLLHSLQLERALGTPPRARFQRKRRPMFAVLTCVACSRVCHTAFLFSYSQYADEAVHLALALHHTGLLEASSAPSSNGRLLDETTPAAPRLCLSSMLEHHVVSWAAEDGVTALQYIFLLRGPPAANEDLSVNVLLHAGVTDVLLNKLAFLAPSTQVNARAHSASASSASSTLSTYL